MSSTIGRLSCFAWVASLALICAPRSAAAQDAAAESLFQTGKEQLNAGKFAEACKSFAESERIEPRVGTLLNLALCNEKQGKIATAWATYKEAAGLARQRNDQERVSAAEGFAAALQPKLAMLTIVVKNPAPGLVVRRDGVEVTAIGVPVAIDPGTHRIDARAPGYGSFSSEVAVSGEGAQKTVEIPPLTKGGPDTVSGGGGVSPLAIAGFVVGGVGFVGLGLGIAFGVIASNTASAAEGDPALCPGKVCTPAGRSEIDSAETQATISTVGFAVGGAALAGGIALVIAGFVSGGSSERSGGLAPFVVPVAGNGWPATGAVAGVEGSF